MSAGYVFPPRQRWARRSCVLRSWRVTIGQEIQPGQTLCIVETEQGIEEIPFNSVEPGWVLDLALQAGDFVPVLSSIMEWSSNGPRKGSMARAHCVAPFVAERETALMISYRRTEGEAHAGRLHEAMVNQFGEDQVFMDQFSILPGEHWETAIQIAAASCALMVVLIGPGWEKLENYGSARIKGDFDLVHREIVAAIDTGAIVIPVLVDRSHLPLRDDLPDDMWPLLSSQASVLTTRSWRSEIRKLLDTAKLAAVASRARKLPS